MSKVIVLVAFAALVASLAIVLAHGLLTLVGRSDLWPDWCPLPRAPFLLWLFVAITILAGVGRFKAWPFDAPSPLVSALLRAHGGHRTLFVLGHGLGRHRDTALAGVAGALAPHGDVLMTRYPADPFSNADPDDVARGLSELVERHSASYERVVVVGHSMGALIARKTYLDAGGGAAHGQARSWGGKVRRVVLLAGTNRGWDLSGKKPMDMRWGTYAWFWFGSWFGRLAGAGHIVLATETGAPFVANLRLEWMRWFRADPARDVEVVQLLGDIDDIVSDEDNKDLRVSSTAKFAWLRVRGTGHSNIIDFAGHGTDDSTRLGEYRKQKFLRAATAPFADLRDESEELPFPVNEGVTHVVFVLHGIRDLGEWSSEFEQELVKRTATRAATANGHLAVASIRYGYFGMGPFVLRADRQKYVRWFMDEYTETLARYPKVEHVDFVGHSNGAYLVTSALERYESLRIRNVVLGGSVVRADYDWTTVFKRRQVQFVRNYVASDDWVVALFPTIFEQRPLRCFGNDIGSAGFNGFQQLDAGGDQNPTVVHGENIRFIRGHHAAFLARTGEIADLFTGTLPLPPVARAPGRDGGRVLKFVSDWLCWLLWLGLATLVIWVGARAFGAAANYGLPAVIGYVALIILLLRAF